MPKIRQNMFGSRATRTHWGSLSAPPDPLATMRGLLLRGRGGQVKEGRREGRRKRMEVKGGTGRETIERREGKGREAKKGLALVRKNSGYGPAVSCFWCRSHMVVLPRWKYWSQIAIDGSVRGVPV